MDDSHKIAAFGIVENRGYCDTNETYHLGFEIKCSITGIKIERIGPLDHLELAQSHRNNFDEPVPKFFIKAIVEDNNGQILRYEYIGIDTQEIEGTDNFNWVPNSNYIVRWDALTRLLPEA